MSKVAVVFWSATGNTEAMANAVADGAKGAGAEVELITAGNFDAGRLGDFDAVAFGCPAMGDEVLEEAEFEPMFESVEGSLNGIKVALFGSYDWGDGQWMRDWVERTRGKGASLVDEGLIVNNTPDDEGLALCRAQGAKLA